MAAGCKRELGTVTLNASLDNVYGEDVPLCWHSGDTLQVNNQTCTISAVMGSTVQVAGVVESEHYRAIFPADIVNDIDITTSNRVSVTLPREQQYEEDSRGNQQLRIPMGAYSSNDSLTFHGLCPLIKVVVSNRTDEDFILDSIRVSAASAQLSGLGNVTVLGQTSDAVKMMATASHDVSLVIPVANSHLLGRGDGDTSVYYIVVPEFASSNIVITLYSGGRHTAIEKSRMTLRNNSVAVVSVTVEQWNECDPIDPPSVDGMLPGLFSVSATRQVRFSQGNLQYHAKKDKWRFAEHQYDYIGNDNRNIDRYYNGWIDLYGWGTGDNPTLATTNKDAYSSFTDWSENAISNGGNLRNTWRPLSCGEWEYVLFHRANAYQKIGTGRINGLGGLIILPDSCVLPSGLAFNPGITARDDDWTLNSYTLTQWAKMEAAGAVFLPAAGSRFGTVITGVGSEGYYWLVPDTTGRYSANYMSFMSSYVSMGSIMKSSGLSVRPVKDNN